MSIGIPCSPPFSWAFSFLSAKTYQGTFFVFSQNAPSKQFKSNVRETWRVILVSEADIFFTESLRILAERLSQSENGLPLRQICYYSPPEEVGVFSTEINLSSTSETRTLLYTGRHFWNRKCRKKTWWQQEFAVFKCEATANSVTGHVCVNSNTRTGSHFFS